MKTVKFLPHVLLIGLLLALEGSVGLGLAQVPELPEEVQPQGEVSIAASVGSKFSYQGVLKESGSPVTGSRDMTFLLYSDDTCTTQVGSDIVKSGVQVTDGLFSVELDVVHGYFNGQGLWLEVEVGGTKIGCQEILPVPYALSLRPGAQIKSNSSGNTLETLNLATGTALWASSTNGAGGYFEAQSFRPDVVLGGPGSGDDGDLWSDPNKSSSDVFIMSNDEVWIDLDEDNTENAAFIIFNGDNQEVFKVDETTGWYGNWSGAHTDVQIRTRDDVEHYLDTTDDSTGVWRLVNTAGNEVIWGREDGDGYFSGDLMVGGAKPAVVQTESHGYRRLYCLESPELWFEDFGTDQLEDGQVKVAFDPLFAETVNLDLDYHVYLTPISDEAVLLFVVAKTQKGFEVQGVTLDGSPSTASFDYRIVAKRLGFEDRRLDAWDPTSEAGASPGKTIIPDLGDEPRVPGESMTFRLATAEEVQIGVGY